MDFLSARTPIVVTWGVLDTAVPMALIMLSTLMFVVFNICRRLEVASTKSPAESINSEAVADRRASAQRKRRTYRQRKQARKSVSIKSAQTKTEALMLGCTDVLVVDRAAQNGLGAGALKAHDVEGALTQHDNQMQSESDDEGIGAEFGDIISASSIDEVVAAEAVRARDRAPVSRHDVDLKPLAPMISECNADARMCSCTHGNTWGCPHHFIYSCNLLLAHREISLKIAKGPPGLELPEAFAAATSTKTCFAARL